MPSSPYLRDLLLRLATLESLAAKGRAAIAALTEATEAADKSAARGEAAAEAELAKHRAQVDEQEEDIVSADYGFTQCCVYSVLIFCGAFLTCSTGRWADTAATVQPNGNRNFRKKTKHRD